MQFLCSLWKILHLTEYFYTGTAHGARNNYQVCVSMCSFVFLCQDLHQTTQLKGIHVTTNQFLPKIKC